MGKRTIGAPLQEIWLGQEIGTVRHERMTCKGREFGASIIPLYPLRLKKWVHLFAMYTSINTASAQH
jgi:hypothetical protein